MDTERARAYLLTLPHVTDTMQWGENLVFWAGDKAIGGKMFALMPLDLQGGLVASFAAGPEGAAELCECEGLRPAPYFARLHWVAAERWDVFSERSWREVLQKAYTLVFERLPPKTRQALELPAKQQAALIAQRRRELAVAKEAAKTVRASRPKAGGRAPRLTQG